LGVKAASSRDFASARLNMEKLRSIPPPVIADTFRKCLLEIVDSIIILI
jgi:hypothetical protein